MGRTGRTGGRTGGGAPLPAIRFPAGLTRAALAAAALLAGITPPQGVLAQPAMAGVSGGGMAQFETYRFSDPDVVALRSISLVSVPLGLRIALPGNFRADVSTAFARGSLERPDGATTTLAGPTDTRMRVGTDALLDGRLSLGSVLVLPTGKDRFSGEEATLAGILAADLLPFGISSWGSGGGIGAEAALSHATGGGTVVIGGSFLVPGEFEAMEGGEFRYRPGTVVQLQAGVDRDVGTASRVSLQAVVQRYGEDALEGQNLFRSGNRVLVLGSWAFPVGPGASSIVWGGVLHRSAGSFLETPDTRPSEALFYGGAGLRRGWGTRVLAPSVEVRLLRREGGEDQGVMAGVGTALEIPSGGVLFVASVRARFGEALVRQGASSGLTGVEVGLGLRRRGEP
jgi:hypothetical protein